MQIQKANLICAEPARLKDHLSAGSSRPFAALLFLLIMLCPLALRAQTNFVYVNNQSGVSNSIASFSVDAGGVLPHWNGQHRRHRGHGCMCGH